MPKAPSQSLTSRSAKSKPPSQKSTPSSARTKSTRYPRQASTLHPKQSGEACSTPSSNPPVADSAHPGRTPPLTPPQTPNDKPHSHTLFHLNNHAKSVTHIKDQSV